MRKFNVTVNGTTYEVEVEEVETTPAASAPNLASPPAAETAAPEPPAAPTPQPTAPAEGATTVEAPMPGSIVSINVNTGDTVNEGDVLCILEAMKMENEIMAPKSGKVVAVCTSQGATVNTGDPLISIG